MLKSEYTPSEKLLFQFSLNGKHCPDSELIRQVSDWDAFTRYLLKNGIAPYFYSYITTNKLTEIIPPGILVRLKSEYFRTYFDNESRFKALFELLTYLEKQKIEYILLKGAALALGFYKDIALRPMSDIDILFKKQDLPEIEKFFSFSGYTLYKNLDLPLRTEYSDIPVFFKNGITIDIHFDLFNTPENFKLDMDLIWNRKSSIKFNEEKEVFVLSKEDQLIHLCYHAYKHSNYNEFRFQPFVEIAEYLRFYENILDWDYILKEPAKWQMDQLILKQLNLISSSFSIPLQIPSCDFSYEADLIKSCVKNDRHFILNNYYLKSLTNFFSNRNTIQILHEGLKYTFPSVKFMKTRYKINNSFLILFLYPYRVLFFFWIIITRLRSKKTG